MWMHLHRLQVLIWTHIVGALMIYGCPFEVYLWFVRSLYECSFVMASWYMNDTFSCKVHHGNGVTVVIQSKSRRLKAIAARSYGKGMIVYAGLYRINGNMGYLSGLFTPILYFWQLVSMPG